MPNIPVSEWSCWGGGVLESDRALDAVSGPLSEDLGINLNFAGDPNHYAADDPECTDKHCSHYPKARSIEKTRKYLDAGNFYRVFRKYQNKQGRRVLGEKLVVTGPEACIFLTAKAMQMGAKITSGQRDWLKSVYRKAGLCREGMEQMKTALEEYENGVPYELVEPNRDDQNIYNAHESARADALGGMARLDYSAADRYFEENKPTPDPFYVAQQMQRRLKGEPTWFRGSPVKRECGQCSTTVHHAENGLQACGACHKILYCSKKCQAKHWKTHKNHCKAYAAAPAPPDVSTLEKSPLLVRGYDPLAGQRLGSQPHPDNNGWQSTLVTEPNQLAAMLSRL